jgi:DNA-binding transcriptional ArsR family regulator
MVNIMSKMDDRALTYVAEYFKALAEPTRLKLLNALRDGEMNVGDLTTSTGCTQANVSKHLSMLSKIGLVKREGRGTNVFYRIADPSIYDLCDLVCGQIGQKMAAEADIQMLFTATKR